MEMVKWIGKFTLLLKRLKNAWMDMWPISAMSQEQRETQYRADVDQLNEDGRVRGLIALDPTSQATRDHWHQTQVANNERSFPYSDNLTTLMFIVASDLSEIQRERLTSTLSLRRMNIPAYTLEAVKTVFVELFCTPKSSMENPSLRATGHGASMSRTFSVEGYSEHECGQWATEEVTGEQGYIDDERSCFWTWDDNEYAWQSRPFKSRQMKSRKGKGKGKGKGGFKGKGISFLGEEQAQDPEWQSQEDGAWWYKGKRGKKGSSKGKNRLSENCFRTYQSEKNASSDYSGHSGRGKERKGKGKDGAYPQSGFSASEAPSEERNSQSWESDDCYDDSSDSSVVRGTPAWYGTGHAALMASVPLNLANHPTHVVLDLCCSRSIGSRSATRRFQKHVLYYGITTEFCPCNKSFVFADSETGTSLERCIIHFPTTPPCSTRVDLLETGNMPILFSQYQMKNLGMTIELDPRWDKITCTAFGSYSSPAEYSTLGHIVLDLTCLAYQPKLRERFTHPKRHVTCALSE